MIDKKLLSELYLEKKLTSYEIAEIFQTTQNVICQWLKYHEIDMNPKQRKFEIIRKIPFSSQQREFITGCLLGRGKIISHGKKSYRMTINDLDKNLILWKKANLGNLVNKIDERENKKTNTMWVFNTVTHNDFNFFHKIFYQHNKKIIRPEVINIITPLSIAVWFADNGSIQKNVSMRIATDKHSQEENELLQEMLKTKFNIRCKVCAYTRHNKEYHYLSFNKINSLLLTELIKPYVIESTKYKIVLESSTTLCQTSNKNDEDIV